MACGEPVIVPADVAVADMGMDLVTDSVIDATPDPDSRMQPSTWIGNPCSSDLECGVGVCAKGPVFPNGFCTQPCDEETPCPSDSTCIIGHPNEMFESFCAPTCERDSACRDGYHCGVASPDDEASCVTWAGSEDDAVCTDNTMCHSDFCWGRCINRCTTDEQCNQQTRSIICDGGSCVRSCDQDDDCDEYEQCEQRWDGQDGKRCYGVDSTPLSIARLSATPGLQFTCSRSDDGQFSFSIPVPNSVLGYQVIVVDPAGRRLRVARDIPGRVIDDNNRGYWSMDVVSVPRAPQDVELLASSTQVFSGTQHGDRYCWAVRYEHELGTSMDVNLYHAGSLLDAESARTDPDVLKMIESLTQTFLRAGIQINHVRHFDVPSRAFEIVTDHNHAAELVSLSAQSNIGPQSVNVFLVDDLLFAGGISMGIAGPVGMHGTFASGVVVPLIDLYAGDWRHTARVTAHEMGHYLGLNHTSELVNWHDRLEDTPECNVWEDSDCPDTNIMFPFGVDGDELTPNQAFVLQRSTMTY